jgi:phage terminase large subunit GpA-like protein
MKKLVELSEESRIWRTAYDLIDSSCTVPERLTITEWADKYRFLSNGVRYDSSVTPYVRRPQDLLDDPDVTMVALAWASQSAKSTIMENSIGFRMHMKPSHMILVRPKIDDAESWARERFDAMIGSTPALNNVMRHNESLLRYKVFLGGSLFVASANSETELASRTASYLYVDEVDRMEILPNEGSPIEIARRRQAATNIGTILLTSTPRHANTTLIIPYLVEGTHETYDVPCTHCGEMQPLKFGAKEKDCGLRWPSHQPLKAKYLCRSCSRLIDEEDKAEMLRVGEWKASNPNASYPSFHLSALYSPFAKSSWGAISEEFERSKGKPYDLQVFVNTRLAETWEEESQSVDIASLGTDRYEEWEEGTVPNGVGLLTAGADIQDGWIDYHVWGWGEGMESWLIHFVQIVGDTNIEPHVPDSVWKELDAELLKTFSHSVSGRKMRVAGAMIDSGYRTGIVYKFTKPRTGRRIFASKGVGGANVPQLGKPAFQGHSRTVLYALGVDSYKEEFLRSQIHTPTHGPGFVHIPTWTNDDWRQQLVNEKKVKKISKGRVVSEWVPKTASARTEALDARIMARASLDQFGPSYAASLGILASEAATTADGAQSKLNVEDDTSPVKGRVQDDRPFGGTSWVRGWWGGG